MQIKPRVLTLSLMAPIIVLTLMVLKEALSIKAPANVYPIVILLTVLFLAALAGVTAIVTNRKTNQSPISIGEPATWITIVAIVLYAFITQFDYLTATSLFLLTLFLRFHPKPLTTIAVGKCIVISGTVTGFVYFSFVSWLGVDAPSWW